MLEQLLNHIGRHKLCKTTDKILLAISGGLDSVVMFHLLHVAGFNIGVAHCNFQLRGEESEGDEIFVKQLCEKLNVPFHVAHFKTADIAQAQKISIQMAARQLRYDFFNDMLAKYSYQYIATAHHLNDSLETVLLNLVRGTGIDGLAGIPVKHNRIIRPMLFASRERLHAYAVENDLSWREDSSNAKDDYHRNFLRHQVIPNLRQINPNLENTIKETLERIEGSARMVKLYLDDFKKLAVSHQKDAMHIDVQKLLLSGTAEVLLWELIKDDGFNYGQAKDIVKEHTSGKRFYSATHQLTIDRNVFIITPKKKGSSFAKEIRPDESEVKAESLSLNLTISHRDSSFSILQDSTVAQLDADKIIFPITWRNWKPGDSFKPLGMDQLKKLSDFLIDIKLPLPEKDSVTVLESAGTILWVVGHRIHHDFRITPQTKKVLTLRII